MPRADKPPAEVCKHGAGLTSLGSRTVATWRLEMQQLLKTREVAAALGLSDRQIRKLAATGRLPGRVRVARSVRYRADVLRAWVAAGCPAVEQFERGLSARGAATC